MASSNDHISNLGGVLSQQFSNSSAKQAATNIAQGNSNTPGSTLGQFANSADRSVDRSYTEEGSFRTDYYNSKPKHLDILMQEPDVTVLVKKRAFASLAENFRTDLMDPHETLFLRATKVLFQNKCKQISAYEKLSKISIVTSDIGRIDHSLLPIIFSATDTLTQSFGAIGLNSIQSSINGSLSKFQTIVNRVREIVSFSQPNYYTTWVTNIPDSFTTNFAQGTGVIEFTNVSSLTTTTSLKFGEGSFSLNFSDPYELMLVTNLDIEQAISDATNRSYSNSFVQLGITALDQTITSQKSMLQSIRSARGAAQIIFSITPNPYSGSVVIAGIGNIGLNINFSRDPLGNVSVDPSALIGSGAAGNDGMNPQELSIFKDIVNSLYASISLTNNNRNQALADNQDPTLQLNLVRKKLRLHYGNKLIIQPMDNVHIYMGSKKRIDTKILGSFQSSFGGSGFLQGLNNLTMNITDTFGVNQNYLDEKSLYVGNDFPNWLWQILRSQFVNDGTGAHVFAGIVENASSSYSNGTFTARAGGSDNAGYFNYGVVNFKPSVEVFNGGLYDPMTPFKLDFDSATGAVKYPETNAGGQGTVPDLLDDNKNIFQSAFVKNKNGLYAGLAPTEDNYTNQDADRIQNNSVRRVFYDPDGFVYRWKEGIGTLVLYGDSYQPNPPNAGAPAITADPFAGQDVVNVLSLLISGEPYNFATFYKSAIQFDSLKRDSSSNQSASISYFRGLTTQLKLKNQIYGNFIPFKQLTMDDQTFTKVQNNQLNSIKFDAELQNYTQQRAALADSLALFGQPPGAGSAQSQSPQYNAIVSQISGIDTQINARINSITNEISGTPNSGLSIVGNDTSTDANSQGIASGNKTSYSPGTRQSLFRQVAMLTKRPAWKVRANEDVNLLIVDDTYDKDYDIQAFDKTPANPEMYKSEYITVTDKIKALANMINFEVFANTQGHIEVRNPKYNRTPSSVFFKMLQMKNELGVQIFPQFLEDLYTNQLTALYTNIEVLEIEIRLYCLALGKTDDVSCEEFIDTLDYSGGTPGGFSFLSTESTGTIPGANLNIALQAQPDQLAASVSSALKAIGSQGGTVAFNTVAVAKLVQAQVIPPGSTNLPNQFANLPTLSASPTFTQRQSDLISMYRGKTGTTFDLSQLFNTSQGPTINTATLNSLNVLQISSGVATRISQRQNAIKTLAKALSNVQESAVLFSGSGGTTSITGGNTASVPSLNQSRTIPQVLEHMIEDESYDDLGPGSSRRYVLKNHDIISYNISENRPAFTSIEVSGRMGDNFIQQNQLPQDLNIFQSGNALITAAAVDYDMWRMYGMQLPTAIDAPYLSDPNTQCAPYAVSLLNQARKRILSGTVEIIGNEYQQPGEVVYLENRDLLFYVDSVTHNFNFGRSFTTSLNITYGHNPGEYIPTFMDVIGKVLYNNKSVSNFVHKKQGGVANQQFIGAIVGNTGTTSGASVASSAASSSIPIGSSKQASTASTDAANAANSSSAAQSAITSGQFGDQNRTTLQQIINLAGTVLCTASDTVNPILELRVYYNSDVGNFASASSYATQVQTQVYNYLIGSSGLGANSNPMGDANANSQSLSGFKSQIVKINVNASPTNSGEFRYPSSKAFFYARATQDTSTSGVPETLLQTQIDNVIYNYIVDCWIVYQNPIVNPELGY
jgi:hypothetical protein